MRHTLNIQYIDKLRVSTRQIVRELGFMHTQLAGTQLSPSAVHTIIELGYGTITNALDLRELLHLDKSSISRLLKKLEADEIIKVDVDTKDKRARSLALTFKGLDVARHLYEKAGFNLVKEEIEQEFVRKNDC